MKNTILYTQCPACGSKDINEVLCAKDYTVSGEIFEVWHCAHCSLRFTQQVPDEQAMAPYYKSDAYISHSNTKKGIVNWLYHLVRKRTLRQKAELVKKYSGLERGALLDIGAGTGAFASVMQLENWQVTALEPDEDARRNAKRDFDIELQEGKDLFSLEHDSFDVVTMWHVLEHVHELHSYIVLFQKILKNKGTLFIAVPNYTSFDATYYEGFWAAYDVPRHLYHFSPASMKLLVAQYGFEVKKCLPMKFDSYYVSLLSEQYKNGNKNLLQSFLRGFQSNRKARKNAEKYSSVIYVIKKQK
ncbi:class I SAM-dependent methyltransferase [Arachidicoccus sp.]|jgi:2-polyprenyl-3-methyl-5-hydroxy-6-metoxy-1,4-benzoquinol methylase|uniref:class I SAM-dependent methyltransferase n=1 Tax=Arachidicoccus sp. TaxID=1872624 RepID=UPI003D22B70B